MSGFRPGSWLPEAANPLAVGIIRRALLDVGICEDPPRSNRSPEIDEYLRKLGVPLGQPWCAAAVAAWFRDCNAAIPPGPGASSTDRWLAWGKAHGLWSPTASLGAAVVYGKRDPAGQEDAQHIGVVVRLAPFLMVMEGNTALDAGNVREGVAVDLRNRTGSTWILGYVRPVSAS